MVIGSANPALVGSVILEKKTLESVNKDDS